MIARTAPRPPLTIADDLARVQQRVLAGFGKDAIRLIRGGQGAIGTGPQLLAALPVAIYTTDAQGRITFYNEAAATLWGQRPVLGSDRYCGSWQMQAADGTPLPHDRTPIALALQGGEAVAGAERIVVRADGSRVAIATFPTLLRDGAGKVTGAIDMLVDLTASRATEAALRESEAHGRSVNELNPQMPWTADPDGRVLEFGERWCAFIGKTRDEALRSNWHGVVNPDDLAEMRAAMRDALTTEAPYDARYRVRTASGEERWVRSRAHPRRDAEGAVIRWYGTTEDIHDAVLADDEARTANMRFHLASEAAEDIAWDLDLAKDVVSWSPALERRFGLRPTPAESNRVWWRDQIHPEDRARVAQTLQSTIAGTGTRLRAEYRFRRADGSYAHVLDRGSLIRDAGGNVVRAIGAMIDLSERKSSEEALRLSEERLRAAQTAAVMASDAAEHIAWDLDLPGDVITWSGELERRFGLWPTPAESTRAWWEERIHPDDRAREVHRIDKIIDSSTNRLTAEYRFRRADGSYAPVLVRGSLIRDETGRIIRAVGAMLDLSERKEAEQALRQSEERFRLAATAAGLGIADVDTVANTDHWSAELRAMLGVGDDVPAGLDSYVALIHPDDRAVTAARHRRRIRGDGSHDIDLNVNVHRIVRPSDGGVRWIAAQAHTMTDDEGRVIRVIVTNKDITDEKTAQDRISRAASHDAVTGLPNRSAFQARFEEALARARREAAPLTLLLIDLDNFKSVNDSLGHQAGDRALIAFAGRIVEAMPEGAIVVRFGGDEFAVILPGTDAASAAANASELTRNLQRPSSIGDRNIDLRASIGAATFPEQGETAADLVQNADLALYAAKANGGATVRAFEPALRARLQDQLSMLSQARAALDHKWIRPFYQPKIALATGRAAGFEALLRWRDPATGIRLPATIACAFDDTELASLIGEAMVLAVLADLRSWLDRGLAVGKIAINASAAEFRGPGFADRLLARLAAFDVPPAMLELEITETAFLGDCAANVVVALEALRAAGMTIALDDFGTGFSSLSHLRNFPVDTIKIDRSFVAGLDDSAEDRAIIEAVLRLGDALGMTTVAEGVETQAQADYLRAHGCTLAQGFLFAPALDAAEVPAAAKADHRGG